MQDEELIRRACEGDRASREALARRWLGRAYAVALAATGRPADAEDVVQEAWLRVFRSLGRLESPRRFGPWLTTIVRNAARDMHRRAGRRRPLVDAAAVEAGADGAVEGPALAAWRALPDDERLVCWLKVMDGLPLHEIGALMGRSKSAVFRIWTNGIARLRRELSRC